jgi:beta-lactamase regulating signal transducer with metallopeptidase domain
VTGPMFGVIEALGLAGALLWIVKATAVLAAGALAARLARHARASVRHLVLTGTFTGLVALPALMAFSPAFAIPVPASLAMRTVTAAPSSLAGGPAVQRVGVEAASAVAGEGAASRTWFLSLASVGRGVRFLWVLLSVASLITLAVSVWRLARLARRGVPWRDAQLLADDVAAAAGIWRTVQVVRHEGVAAPFTCGVRTPTIVLPWDAQQWTDADVRRALVHELEHVRRADWPLLLVARAICSVYWFHPLAWRALRALCLEAERACDDAVLASSGSEDYADQLVALAGRARGGATLPALAMAGRSDLSVRVRALLDAGQRRGRAGRWAAVWTLGAALLGVSALGAVRTVAAETIVNRGTGTPSGSPGAEAPEPREPLGPRVLHDAAAAAEQRRTLPAPEAETEREDEDEESSPGYALYHAARRGNLRLMTALIDGGANVNAALSGDGSPLIGAARSGRVPAVQLLLDRGADVNMGVGGDGNPLIMAAREGHVDVARLLLANGARVDDVVDGDENALIQASGHGQLEMARLLVSHGADVNARVWADSYDGRGEWRTPLSQARRGGHTAVIAFLETSGARQ